MTNEITNEELARLKELAKAATPGPWEATRQTDEECNFVGYFIEAGDKTISDDGVAPDKADALFIAAANPAAILALIAKVESLAADAERWRFSMDFQRNAGQPIPEPMTAMWRKVRDDGRLNPTVEEYEAAIDAAMAKEKA